MAYTPYDWQQTLRQKGDYVEDRLRKGSPVVGLGCREGILLLTTRRTQRKIFEIYDRLAFCGLGNPSDLEAVRQHAVDFAHAEGYQRSPEDVSIQRVVGFAISPVLKRAFADPVRTPLVLRAIFAQVGRDAHEDLFFILGYDGEFTSRKRFALVAGADFAEQQMERVLAGENEGDPKEAPVPELEEAIGWGLRAWTAGRWALQVGGVALGEEEKGSDAEVERLPSQKELQSALAEAMERETVEAALLDRGPERERRLRFLEERELAPHVP